MRLLSIAVASCTGLQTKASTFALVSNLAENPISPPRRRLRTNLFDHSTATPQVFPSSGPSSDDPGSLRPSIAASDITVAAAVGEVSTFDEPLALTTFAPATSMPTSQQTTSRQISSTPTTTPTSMPASPPVTPTTAPMTPKITSTPNSTTPTSLPTESKSASTPTTSQPTAPKSITSILFTTAALDVNTTTASSHTTCSAETVNCGPSRTCASLNFDNHCCSQWGYCGQTEPYCGACCLNGPCWEPTYYPTYSPTLDKIPTTRPTSRKPSSPSTRPTSRKPSSPTTRPTSRKPSSTTTLMPTSNPSSTRPTTFRPTTIRPTTGKPNSVPTPRPSSKPTITTTSQLTTSRPSTTRPTSRRPTTARPTTCSSFTFAAYDAIDTDIATLKNNITNNAEGRAHFLGGIVRLAAHDFMDFNATATPQMGADGCFDPSHPSNAGLSSIWSSGSPLFELHRTKYSHITIADFWVASANAVIRQTSNNALNLRATFQWGRIDSSTCIGSGQRLPIPSRCRQVEAVFLTRMGLTWREAVALLGAHTLGRGNAAFSGHHGTWKDNNTVAQVFDKQYYRELLDNNWRMIFNDGPQDWTTGNLPNDRMMLNTDICLKYDIDDQINQVAAPCTTRSIQNVPTCPVYGSTSTRRQASDAVDEFANGADSTFYTAFSGAWNKATAKGQSGLRLLAASC